MITRTLAETLQRSKKSVLVLGPRQTGKSTLMHALQPDLAVNLALESTFLEFARNPDELPQRLAAVPRRTIFIDEVQRLPGLLNTIQAVLDSPGAPKFYLTGSSARKLRRGQANLLPGRLHTYHLGALTVEELGYNIDLTRVLATGTLPGIWTEPDEEERRKTLRSYASTYLKEEIQAEALTRNIEGFSRFLFVIATCAGQFLDLAKLASEAGIPRQSAVRYFEVLEDTLIIQRCAAFRRSARTRLVQHPRFFFFDVGVLNGLLGNFTVSADRLGALFEHWLFTQMTALAAAHDVEARLSSYRTSSGAEVDFILQWGRRRLMAVEVKASTQVTSSDLRGLRSFADYYRKPHYPVVVYQGAHRKKINDIDIIPWQDFLRDLAEPLLPELYQ